MTCCGYGRLTKKDIAESLHTPLPKDVVPCPDGHAICKGHAGENRLKHVVLRDDLKQRVKRERFHIQHVNPLHNRLKKWIVGIFRGTAAKYLQNYLNRFKAIETVMKKREKSSQSTIEDVNDGRMPEVCNAMIDYIAIKALNLQCPTGEGSAASSDHPHQENFVVNLRRHQFY